MPKKRFTDNPALQFITALPQVQPEPVMLEDTSDTYHTHNTPHAHNTDAGQERKTKRLNLLIRPSLLADISKIAHMRRTSVNDLINSALEEYRQAHDDAIAEYDRVFPE